MPALTITYAVGTYPQAGLLKLAKQIERAASELPPSVHGSGPSIVCTLTSTDAPGVASVQITTNQHNAAGTKYYI